MKKYKPMKIEEDADLKKIKSHPEEWQKEVDHIEVDVQPPYGILDFSRFKKLNFIKENLQNNYYNENFRLSNKVIISQRIISDDVSDINSDSGYDPILNYRYNPGEVDLFKEVINIKLTPSSILNFVNKFGLLESDYIYKKQSYRNYMQNGSNMITVFSHNIITPLVEDYDVFINNVKKIKSLYALWLDFKADKLKIEELKQYIISLAPENIKDIEKINSDNYKDLFFNLFRIELNINLRKLYITPHLITGPENSFLPGYTYSNLFNLVYIQFYKAITEETSYKKCQYCGSYFMPKSKNRIDKFCPSNNDYRLRIHSVCNERYNSMKNKYIMKIIENKLNESKVRKLASNIKWTNLEDQTHYGRPYREVKSWIENYEPRSDKTISLFKEYINSDNSII